jgi:hypothetical protein
LGSLGVTLLSTGQSQLLYNDNVKWVNEGSPEGGAVITVRESDELVWPFNERAVKEQQRAHGQVSTKRSLQCGGQQR